MAERKDGAKLRHKNDRIRTWRHVTKNKDAKALGRKRGEKWRIGNTKFEGRDLSKNKETIKLTGNKARLSFGFWRLASSNFDGWNE